MMTFRVMALGEGSRATIVLAVAFFWILAAGGTMVSKGSQSSDALTFEVASVRRNLSERRGMSLRILPGGRFNVSNYPLRALITKAYGLQVYQILGGPEWMGSAGWQQYDGFDIVATFDAAEAADGRVPSQGADDTRVMRMLQALLAERFKLRMHAEMRELQYYALVVATPDGRRGDGIRPSNTDCAAYWEAQERRRTSDGSPRGDLPSGPHCGLRFRVRPGLTTMSPGAVMMSEFAEYLQAYVGRMVVDETGLTGRFDLDLTFTPDPTIFPVPPFPGNRNTVNEGVSIFVAVQEQLGLQLESRRGPVEVLIVDNAERPTPN